MRKHYLWIGILFLVCQLAIPHPSEARDALASGTEDDQAQTVSGTVKDNEGNSIPGVNIVLKGTASGTITDSDGKYTMSVPDGNAVLVFSFIGFTQQEVSVAGRSTVDVSMAADVKALDEVVVTALGIERSQKSLGYSTTKVAGDELSVNRTTNPMNALQGKIAGVNISGMGGGPMGTSKIRIRGQSSISGQNNPLIVVNGVPIDNTNFGSNINNAGSDNSYGARAGGGVNSDGGDAFSSMNPDDIESINVLKGATAAALYGSRAKDGVIMITTKSKGTSKGIGVTYNLNYSDEQVLDYTNYQYDYGQGENGVRPTTPNPSSGQWSFGERIQPGMTQTLFNTPNVPYVAQKGILNQFYRHGQNMTNTVSVASTGEKGGMNVSISNTTTNGVTPNNTFDRKTINWGFSYDLSDRLSVRGNMNYSNEVNKNPPVTADQDNSIPTSLYGMANTMPLTGLGSLQANMYNTGGGEYNYSRFTNRTNPYWAMAEQRQTIRRDRIFGNMSAKYDLAKWLYVQVRAGQDYWSRDNDAINLPTGKASINSSSIYSSVAPGYFNGVYTQESRRFRETNLDFLVAANKDFGDFGLNVTVGGNQLYRRMDYNSTQVTDFAIRGLYTVQNGRAKDPQYQLIERGVNSLYATAELNYKKYIYFNTTFRNDWFSTLAAGHNSVPYYSFSTSYVFSESFNTKPSWLTSGRFRASWARVGSDGDVQPYSNALYYGVNANQFAGQPVGNITTSTLPNPNLHPMTVDETELGLELKMFDNRLTFDVAVYKKITSDQIVGTTISDASGYINTLINSGKSQSQGIELMINAVAFKSRTFEWDVTYAGAYNITKVLSLLNDTPGSNITTGTNVFNGSTQQIVGQEMGQIVGYGYRRDAAGNQIFGSDGIFLPTTSQISFGSALPKWTGGLTNSFNYKGITFSFLIDYKLGNKMLSGTNFNAIREGNSMLTLPGRETGVVGVGVTQAGTPNTVAVPSETYWSAVRGLAVIEPAVFDGGYIKLRQITVGYDFTKHLPAGSPFKGLKLSAFANNVFIIKKWVDNIDPEAMSLTSDNLVGMEAPGVPTTRTLGFNLTVKF